MPDPDQADLARGQALRSGAMKGTLYVTGDAEADALVNTDPFAAVLALLLDQQMR